MDSAKTLRPWNSLAAEEQLRLQQDYQVELDRQPLTCSMDTKIERFSRWLEGRGVRFTREDL